MLVQVIVLGSDVCLPVANISGNQGSGRWRCDVVCRVSEESKSVEVNVKGAMVSLCAKFKRLISCTGNCWQQVGSSKSIVDSGGAPLVGVEI